ncbi:MAG: glycosyltransferase [Flavobacteriales bacterium]|nr:glycosyltransferase [Flavobacteriales bacterium]
MKEKSIPENTCVCLPTYNEAESVKAVVENIRQTGYSSLLFIVDGFSTDGTLEIARNLQVPVFHRPRSGKGSALRMALEIAHEQQKEHLIYLDCDQTYDAADLRKFLAVAEDADLIIGKRPPNLIRPFFRRLGNRIATSIVNLNGIDKIEDTLTGFKCLRVSKFRTLLNEDGFVVDALICVLALHYKMRILHLPIRFSERVGKSKIGIWIGLRELVKLIHAVVRIKLGLTKP